MKAMRVIIIGTGKIGTDLLIKCLRSPYLTVVKFVGRNLNSPGMIKAQELGVPVSAGGIQNILDELDSFDVLFDATSAKDHVIHWEMLKNHNKKIVDLTPSNIGKMIVPAVNLSEEMNSNNIGLISCGGQASLAIVACVKEIHEELKYVEVVSTIASKSAGPATRLNINEYIETTEMALKKFSGCKEAKSILILNPAEPCVDMQTTIYAIAENPQLELLHQKIIPVIERLKKYVPGYELVIPPVLKNNSLVISIKVVGSGDYLPSYAGNLDIINCAALAVAEEFSQRVAYA